MAPALNLPSGRPGTGRRQSLADRIYVLDRGRIAEQGTRELLMAGGRYADLYTLQASAYDMVRPA